MPNGNEYERMIGEYDNWEKLRGFREKVRNRETPGWDAGKAFEYLVLQIFRLGGASVRWPYSVKIEQEIVEQIDGFVHIGRFSCIIESKQTQAREAITPIAKMRNQLLRRHSGAIGLVFSESGFTEAAIILARYIAPQAILLWTGTEVDQIFADGSTSVLRHLEYKYRHCLEAGIPDSSIQQAAAPVDLAP